MVKSREADNFSRPDKFSHDNGTVPGGRWTIDTEGGHVVVSVSLMRNGYEYGTVPDHRGTIHTESGHVVNSVSRMRLHQLNLNSLIASRIRSGYESCAQGYRQLP